MENFELEVSNTNLSQSFDSSQNSQDSKTSSRKRPDLRIIISEE